jgi:tetratricopeptide (TPR) repeat protein
MAAPQSDSSTLDHLARWDVPSNRAAADSVSTVVPATAVENLIQELRERWDQGERPPIDAFLAHHPELRDDPVAIDLIYEKICLREQIGEKEVWQEALRRFPQFGKQLQNLHDCHRLLEPNQPAPRFPAAGESMGGFCLLEELGHGARGRVFLATQPNLANRLVVLKLTPRLGCEHSSMAQLQHTNIVPLYSARDDCEREIRLLCMPFLGRATLAQLLKRLSGIAAAERTGRDLIDALEQLQGNALPPVSPVAAPREFLARATYVQTICWIGACYAEALHYAHERGLVHLDVKPSNVLVAADGQPMLLDFHLAHEPLLPGRPLPMEFGGTLAYMPPEQRAAMEALAEGRQITAIVDGRADIYSLGAVLYEALGGDSPNGARELAPIRRLNSEASVGLSDIVTRCLSADPGQRYPTAAALAADLRRHLANHPLQGVPNRSLIECWQKWRKRRPRAFPRALLFLVLLGSSMAAATCCWLYLAEQHNEALRALHEGHRQLHQQREYNEASATLKHGLARIEKLPFWSDLAQRLAEQLRQVERARERARRQELVRNLHGRVEQLRLVLEMDGASLRCLRELEYSARALWEQRDLIRARLGKDSGGEVDKDLLELASAWSSLSRRLAGPEETAAARLQASQVLQQARDLFGPQALRDQDLQAQLSTLCQPADWITLGRSLLRAGRLERAAEVLKAACEREPHNPWANYYYGVCAYRQEHYETAALAFSVCIGAAPHLAGCYYSRALALTALRQHDQAIHDYDRALQLDPEMAGAWLNRGMLHYQEGRYDRALADLRAALDKGADETMVYFDLALVHVARHELEAALTCVERSLKKDPQHPAARRLRAKLLATH